MNLYEAFTALRERLDDETSDYLWGTAELVRYLSEAQIEFCRRRPIRDSGYTLSLAAGQAAYDLDCEIYAIEQIKRASTGLPLAKATHEMIDWYRYPSYPDGRVWIDTLSTQPVSWYYEDLDDGYLYLAGTPTEADTLNMVVLRGPIRTYSYSATTSVMTNQRFEIAERFHPSLLHWACHLAYLKRDSDTYNVGEADRCEAAFTRDVGPKIDASHDLWRKRMQNRRPRAKAHFL